MAAPRTSVRLKLLRRRFGIGAPKLSIKRHVAWHWRILAPLIIGAILYAAGAWIYDARQQIGTNHPSEEIESLRKQNAEQEVELTQLRSLADTSESHLQMERAAQKQLAHQVKTLEQENASLREDLAFFEGLMPRSDMGDEVGVRINNLRIERTNVDNEYSYRMLIINSGNNRTKEFKGNLQLVIKVQQGGKNAMIVLPSATEPNPQYFRFEIKHFHRLEGRFLIPAEAVVKNIEVRLLQAGNVRAKESITF